jgi:hypothetical protein
MSVRVTQKTEIKDKELAIQALKLAGVTYNISGNTLSLHGGSLNGCRIDLSTGDISGDSDYGHTAEKIGIVRQYYSEAKVRHDLAIQGHTVESKEIVKGDVILHCYHA